MCCIKSIRIITACIDGTKEISGTGKEKKKKEGAGRLPARQMCGAACVLYMEKYNDGTIVDERDTGSAGIEPGKAVRLTHHTKRIVFPRDGKKAKAYFRGLKEGYSRCWCVNRIQDTFRSEISYYQENYGDIVEAWNRTYMKNRHTDRMITMKDLHGRERTCPEELFIQAGKKNGAGIPGPDVFKGCIMQYLSWMQEWNREHGDHMHVLNVHVSDKSPYRAVVRRVWDCIGENGVKTISMTRALEEAAVPYLDEGAEESRYNNRKMTFDRLSREALYRCFEDAGIMINREPGIHTLRQALKVRKDAEFEEEYAKDMLRQIMEIEGQAPAMDAEGEMPGIMETPDGSILVPEESCRLLKIRECLGGAYAARSRQAAVHLLKALEDEREANAMRAMQEGDRKNLELEYAALRVGLLRCGYYAGPGRRGD